MHRASSVGARSETSPRMRTRRPVAVVRRAAALRRGIFIVEDHPVTRMGLSHLIRGEPDLRVVGEAGTADAALAAIAGIRSPWPDLVVADISMPGKNVIEFIKDLHALHPEVAVLIFSMHDESVYAERMVRAGARGYIMKSEGGGALLQAIRQVLRGEPYLSRAMSAQVIEALGGHHRAEDDVSLGSLTDREFEVFELLGEGKTNREVAKQLSISPKTVEAHRMNLSRKLQFGTAAQLMRRAVLYSQAKSQSS
jgi:DNA-binding NarL/FixJ family response regulator